MKDLLGWDKTIGQQQLTPGIRRILCGANVARVKRGAQLAMRNNDPRVLLDAVALWFVEPAIRLTPDTTWAANVRRAVIDCQGHINAMVDTNKGIYERSNGNARGLIRNVSTVTAAFADLNIAEYEILVNRIFLIMDEIIANIAPAYRRLAMLDEVEFRAHPGPPRPGKKPIGHFQHYTVGSGKAGMEGRPVHRFHVGVIAIPLLKIRYPIFFSLYTDRNKWTEAYLGGFASVGEVVQDFLGQLEEVQIQPRYVYMDRWYGAFDALDKCVAYTEAMLAKNTHVDFVIPAKRYARPDYPNKHWAEFLKRKTRRGLLQDPPSVSELISNGQQVAQEPMTARPSWKFRTFTPTDPHAPCMPDKVWLTIVNAPRDDIGDGKAIQDHGPTRSFACWSTCAITANNAYDVLKSYTHRNYVEAMFKDYRRHFGMCRSPRMALRVATFGLSLFMLSALALFRIKRGNELGRYEHDDMSIVRFLGMCVPSVLLDILQADD